MSRQRRSNDEDQPDEMKQAVERLAEVVGALTSAVDEMTRELQWENNRRRDPSPSPHLPLTKLPTDPTTRHWRPTFGRDTPAEAASREPAAEAPAGTDSAESDPRRRFYDQLVSLSSEVARLEQVAALLVIAVSERQLEEPEASAWMELTDWAYEWFDREMLRESLAEIRQTVRPELDSPASGVPTPAAVSERMPRQQGLFSDEPAGEHAPDSPPT